MNREFYKTMAKEGVLRVGSTLYVPNLDSAKDVMNAFKPYYFTRIASREETPVGLEDRVGIKIIDIKQKINIKGNSQ